MGINFYAGSIYTAKNERTFVVGVYITRSKDNIFLIAVTTDEGVMTPANVVSVPHTSTDPFLSRNKHGCRHKGNHFENCSMNKALAKKNGTYEMVTSTLELIAKITAINTFQVHDESTSTCEANGARIILRKHNILLYGISWYERK